MKKAAAVAFAAALVLVTATPVVVMGLYPKARPPSTEKVEITPERVARGKYLADGLADCFTCHADHQDDIYARPVKPGTKGRGGFAFDKKYHVPGLVQAQNITPDPETGIGNWTDGEIIRAIREGIGRDGRALFPMMPYEFFRHMSDEDVKSIVAFLRTLPPIRNKVQEPKINFPFNLVIRFNPEPVEHPIATPKDTTPASWEPRDEQKNPAWKQHLDYGDYLVTVAGCIDCHTQHNERMERIKGMEFAGGYKLIGPWGEATSANITPHPDSYIGQASKEQFVSRFKAFASIEEKELPKIEPSKNSFMPWWSFRETSEEDLGAIYDFLRNRVKPVKNKVNSADFRYQDGKLLSNQ